MTSRPYLGLRRCMASVPLLFPRGASRSCTNPATRRVGERLLCAKHSRGDAVKITIEFEQGVLDVIEAARLVLATTRAIKGPLNGIAGGPFRVSGPIVDEHGTVLGQWKAESTKKRKAA